MTLGAFMMRVALVTNDDGIESPALRAAAVAVGQLATVVVAAPLHPQSSMGRSFPKADGVGRIHRYDPSPFGDSCIEAFGIEGSPAQAVSYAVLELIPRLPDICVSGINLGENVGATINGSGTVGAAMEASCYRIPAIAVSLQCCEQPPSENDLKAAGCITVRVVEVALNYPWPAGVDILNVNIPRGADSMRPMRQTVPTRQPYYVFERGERIDFSKPCALRARTVIDLETLESDSDVRALLDGVVSVSLLTTHLGVEAPWPALSGL